MKAFYSLLLLLAVALTSCDEVLGHKIKLNCLIVLQHHLL